MGTGYVFASVNTSSSGQSLTVQTDKFGPMTVPSGILGYIDNTSVTSNFDGSFDVFWSEFTLNTSTHVYTYTDFEQAYSANGALSGGTKAIAHGRSIVEPAWDATATAAGGYVLASVQTSSAGQTLVVRTDKLKPIPVTTASGGVIDHTVVTSNADGSFAVFWSTSSFDYLAGITTYTDRERSYSATGIPLGGPVKILSGSTNNFTVQPPWDAAATTGGGYVFASTELSSGVFTLSVQTDKLTTIPLAGGTGLHSVKSNSDGSFDLFYSTGSYDQTTGIVSYLVHEQSYSASGSFLGPAIDIASGTNIIYPVYDITGTNPSLFTTGADDVNFNSLNPDQIAAVNGGAKLYNSLDGDDSVTLPNSTVIPGVASNITWDPLTPFLTGNGDDTVQTGKLTDRVLLGHGADTVYGSRGNDTIVGGAGADTFDYTHGDFANFSGGFASGTTQTLVGSHKQFIDDTNSANQNEIILPGSPNDYQFSTTFTGDSLTSAVTTIKTTGADGLPSGITINTKDIEKATFDEEISNPVKPRNGSISAEMLQLAVASYGPLPTLSHRAEPLAYSAGDTSLNAAAAAQGVANWHEVSAIELGMAPADFGQYGTLKFSFKNGVYQAINTKDAFLFNGDMPEADALVLTGVVDSERTLAIAFRGTDQIADFNDYTTFSKYYAKYQPLLTALHDYLSDPASGIQKVLVSGHSLGAGALQYFMNEFPNTGAYTVQGYTDGSPGAEVDAGDLRIENFVNTGDPVPLATAATSPFGTSAITAIASAVGGGLAGAAVGTLLAAIQAKTRAGADIRLDDGATGYHVSEHNAKLYVSEVTDLSKLAADANSPFSGSALGEDLIGNVTYTGPTLSIAVEAPTAKQVTIAPADTWALGNGGDQINWLSPGPSVTPVVIDGGPGGSSLELPGASLYYSWQPGGSFGTSLETVLSELGVQIGQLYRIAKLIFPFTGSSPVTPVTAPNAAVAAFSAPANQYIVRLDGAPLNVQSPMAGKTTVTVNSSFDYLDAGDKKLTITGFGKGGDIIALGAGNDIVNESGGNNVIFVKDAATAGNITVNTGAGDNTVVTGAGNDRLVGGSGANTFAPGGGGNFVNGGFGNATLMLTAAESEYAFAGVALANGTVETRITHVGSTGSDGTDTVINVKTVDFGDGSTATLVTGTTGNDTFTDRGVDEIITGGAGTDVFNDMGFLLHQVSASIDGHGDVEIVAPEEFDVLSGVSKILLNDATITVANGTLKYSVPRPLSVATFLADQSALDMVSTGFSVSDTAANVSGALDTLSPDTHVKGIGISDNKAVVVTVGQLTSDLAALQKLKNANGAPYQIAVLDSADNIEALTTSQIAGLPLRHVTKITSADANLSLSMVQALAFGTAGIKLPAPSGDSVSVSDLAASIEALKPAQILGLGLSHVSTIAAIDASLTLTAAQAIAFEVAHIALSPPSGDSVSVSDTAAHLAALTAAQLAGLPKIDVTSLHDSSGNVLFSAAQTSVLLANNIGLSASGTYRVAETFTNGAIVSFGDDGSGGGRLNLGGGNGLTVNIGASLLSVTAGSQTTSFAPHATETISAAAGLTHETFVFGSGFGTDTMNGFVSAGASHDLLQFSATAFGETLANTQTEDFSALLAHTTQNGAGNAVIADTFGDTLTIVGVSLAALTAHPADFKFV
jgi:hypothetical protein